MTDDPRPLVTSGLAPAAVPAPAATVVPPVVPGVVPPVVSPAGSPAVPPAVASAPVPAEHADDVAHEGAHEGLGDEPAQTAQTQQDLGPAEDPANRLREALRDSDASTPIGEQAMAAVRIRSGSEVFPKPARRRVITVANQKGGVGKTTSAVNLSVSLALGGATVLVIDLDPQGNASTALGVPHHAGVPDVYSVLVDSVPMADVVQPAGGVDRLRVVPATIDLAGAEIELVSLVARESRLQRAVEAYCAGAGSDVDYVIIDCPPSLGLLTVNAMVATAEVLIPIQCEYYALEGLGQLLKTIDMVKAHLNPALAVSTILLTMYDARTKLADQVVDEVRTHFGDLVLTTRVPRSVRVSEAPGYGQSVVTYDPGSRGALAYVDAAREIAVRGAT